MHFGTFFVKQQQQQHNGKPCILINNHNEIIFFLLNYRFVLITAEICRGLDKIILEHFFFFLILINNKNPPHSRFQQPIGGFASCTLSYMYQ